MKKSAFTLLAFLAMTSVTLASVTLSLDLVDGDLTHEGTALDSYVLKATGVGITTLSKFTIGHDLYQVWTPGVILSPPAPSEWDGDTSVIDTINDSYVMFGTMRIPDLPNVDPWPGPGVRPAKTTAETIKGHSVPPVSGDADYGMGTLNNHRPYSDNGTPEDPGDDISENWDSYLELNAAAEHGAAAGTVSLLHLVVADGTDTDNLDIALTLFTATDYEYVGGEVDNGPGESTVTQYDLVWPAAPIHYPGDANDDLTVDLIDLGRVADNWGTGDTWAEGDFNGDLTVDLIDLGRVADNWGNNYPLASAVPEPSTIVMLILGALCLVGYRVRK